MNGKILTTIITVTILILAAVGLVYYLRGGDFDLNDLFPDSDDNQNDDTNTIDCDLNGDGVVNDEDKDIMMSHYMEEGPPGWIPSDVNEDGIVDMLDVSLLTSKYGQ